MAPLALALASFLAAVAAVLLARPAWRSLQSTESLRGWSGGASRIVLWTGATLLLLLVAVMALAISSVEPQFAPLVGASGLIFVEVYAIAQSGSLIATQRRVDDLAPHIRLGEAEIAARLASPTTPPLMKLALRLQRVFFRLVFRLVGY